MASTSERQSETNLHTNKLLPKRKQAAPSQTIAIQLQSTGLLTEFERRPLYGHNPINAETLDFADLRRPLASFVSLQRRLAGLVVEMQRQRIK